MKSFRYIVASLVLSAAPALASVSVSSPTSGATVSSPVSYVATASTTTCAKGVASMGIYVNNTLVYVVDAAKMNTTLSLGAGGVVGLRSVHRGIAHAVMLWQWASKFGSLYSVAAIPSGDGVVIAVLRMVYSGG